MKNILLLIIVISIFYSCSATKSIEDIESPSAERIVKRIEANRRKIKTFIGSGTIYVNTKELNTKSNFKVEVKKPDSLKISFFGPFGIELASALVTKKDYIFFDMINNNVIKGKATNESIKSILKVNFPYDEIIEALTGSINLSNKLNLEPSISKNDDNSYVLVYVDSLNNQKSSLVLDIYSFRLNKFYISSLTNKIIYQASYDDFKKVDDVPVPTKIEIKDISNNQNIKIEYRKIEVNNLNEKLKIEVPDDAVVKEL